MQDDTYLEEAITKKDTDFGVKNNICYWGSCSMQGWRNTMEDTHISHRLTLPNGSQGMLFGVFDGHRGHQVAHFAKQMFRSIFIGLDEFKEENYRLALKKAFFEMDE